MKIIRFLPNLRKNQPLGLSNRLREGLLRLKQGAVALVLDAMLAHHLTGYASVAEISSSLAGISPDLIRAALKTTGCFSSRPRKTAGRPCTEYRIATFAELTALYGIESRGYHRLPAEALTTLSNYRKALYALYFQTHTDVQTSRGFLAYMISVCQKTTRRYDKTVKNLRVIAQISRVALKVSAALRLGSAVIGGVWIECCGKKLPALRHIALHLVKCGYTAVLCRQRINRYVLEQESDL